MLIIIFIIWLLFWTIYYIFQGLHDTHVIKEVEAARSKLTEADSQAIENQIIHHEIKWKFWDSLEKALTKFGSAFLIYMITFDTVFSILLLLLSIFIRWIVHDMTVAIALRGSLKHIGPDFVWTDKLLRKLANKGLNQYTVKTIPALLCISLIVYHIVSN